MEIVVVGVVVAALGVSSVPGDPRSAISSLAGSEAGAPAASSVRVPANGSTFPRKKDSLSLLLQPSLLLFTLSRRFLCCKRDLLTNVAAIIGLK
jgi:hypothetical protein